MKLLRNPDLKKELTAYLIVTAAASAALFFVHPLAGGIMIAAGLLFCVMHILFAKKRYSQMEALSEDLSKILHGQDDIQITDCSEGELAILESEIRKMTVMLKERNDALQGDKNRLTEAIQDIFHQIRTPLTSMNLAVSMLREEDLDRAKKLELTLELKKELESIKWLVETLLKLSKIDAGTAEFRKDTINVKELADKAAGPLLIPMELREQSFAVHASDESFTGDMNWSSEALSNILKNCMEHTPAGGSITVSACETALFTELVVTDTGPGFKKEEIAHVFERFYKGSGSSDESVGIGLALSRSIIAAQNGTITASNSKEGGALFTIRFYKSVV